MQEEPGEQFIMSITSITCRYEMIQNISTLIDFNDFIKNY